jgi:hypothetical protein
MIRNCLALVALLMAAPAWAQEPAGCDKFKWPLDGERALLAKPSETASGGEASLGAAVMLALVPLAEAKLPVAPSRPPKFPDSYAGFVRVSALSQAGTYRITLAHGAWIDVVQGRGALKPTAFSGSTGCEGLAKSIKFELTAAPFVVELSGTSAHAVALVVTPD